MATRLIADARAVHFWDGNGLTLKAYQTVLGLPGDAWDVYMLYGPDARWDDELPPKPDFWMHQLGGDVAAPFLDPDVFAARAKALLAPRP